MMQQSNGESQQVVVQIPHRIVQSFRFVDMDQCYLGLCFHSESRNRASAATLPAMHRENMDTYGQIFAGPCRPVCFLISSLLEESKDLLHQQILHITRKAVIRFVRMFPVLERQYEMR